MTSALTDNPLVDTNILVYSVHPAEGHKASISAQIVRALMAADQFVLSTQIILEFYRAVALPKRKQTPILTRTSASVWIDRWLGTARLLTINEAVIRDAIRASSNYRMQLFDAAIWATARIHGCNTIVTEDMPSQPRIEGVRYVNPFEVGFELADIGL